MDVPGGIAGAVSAAAATIIGGSLWLRKWLSRDAVERAGDKGTLSVIDMMQKQIDREREHSAQLMSALDSSHEQIGELRKQVADLTDQVRVLQGQVRALGGDP